MARIARTLLAFAVLFLLIGPACAQDGRKVERALRAAADAIRINDFDRADRYLEDGRKDMAELSDELKAKYEPQFVEMAEQAAAQRRAYERERYLKVLDRQLSGARDAIESGQRGKGDRSTPDNVEHWVEKTLEALASEDADVLTDEDRAEQARIIADLRAQGQATKVTAHFNHAEQFMERAEETIAGEGTYDVDQQLGYVEDELKECPDSDARLALMRARIAKVRQAYASQVAQAGRDEVVGGSVDYWKSLFESYAGESEGWEQETADYERFLSSNVLGIELTEKRCQMLSRMTDDTRYAAAKAQYGDDPETQKLVAEVDAAIEAAAGKLCSMATEFVAASKVDTESSADRMQSPLERLEQIVERNAQGAQAYDATLAGIRARIAEIKGGEAAAGAAAEAMLANCTAAALEAWPRMLEAYADAGDIEPSAAVDDIGSWKGKQIRLEDYPNRAGWDYDQGSYDFITPIDGIPVACYLDEGLSDAIDAWQEATGLEFDDQEIEDLVAVVERTGKVQGMTYSQLLEEHVLTDLVEAPILRIVALKAGPLAVSLEGGSNLAFVEGLEEISVGGGGGSSGGTWLWLCLGFACCFLVLGGGVGGLVLYQRQMAASAGAGPASDVPGPAPGATTTDASAIAEAATVAPAASALPQAAPTAPSAAPPLAAPPLAAPPVAAPPVAAPLGPPPPAPPSAPPAAPPAPPAAPPAPPAAPPAPPAAPPAPPAAPPAPPAAPPAPPA